MNNNNFYIKENSLFARLAAKKLKSNALAMVLGKTIHLHNISKEDFLHNKRLLRHELCHVRQYQQHGYLGFLIKYFWESIMKGYYNNKFEVEARQAEEALDDERK
ncbi:MAG: DUF4157 domain-containing protein [Ferruginibacter sp.]